jgi:hypothetical protein
MQSVYDRLAPKIESESKAARAKAAKFAEQAERRSIPGVTDVMVDTEQGLTNVMMEAAEIRERAKRIEERTPDFAEAGGRVTEMLRNEYAEAMQTGGLAGATTCQAVLRAAKTLGIGAEQVYDHMREEKHWLGEQSIPTHVPSLDRGVVRENHWRKGGSPRLAIPRGGAIAGGKKRRPSWR